MPAKRRARHTVVLIAVAAGFAQFFAVASLSEVARHFGHAGGGDSFSAVVGLSGTTISLGLAVIRVASLAALPIASLADRWGRREVLGRIVLSGMIVTAAASLSPSYVVFVVMVAVARPLLSASISVVQVIAVELTSARSRVTMLTLVAGGVGIGSGFAAVLHGLLPGSNAFRILFATALVPAAFVAPRLSHLEAVERPIESGVSARLGAIPRGFRGQMAILCTLGAVVGVITGPANGFAFVYSESVLKISRHEVAVVVTLGAITGLGGLVLGRWLADTVGRRPTVVLGALSTAATSVLAYSGGRVVFIVGFLIGVGAAGLLAPAANALVNEVLPHHARATGGGWMIVASVTGAVIGLITFGFAGDVLHSTIRANSLRVPALVTFLPLLPLLGLLLRLPETRGSELS